VYCKLFEIDYNRFPLNENFEIDIDSIDESCGGIIFPNPNAPTGIYLDLQYIETLLQKFPDRLVIVDEAYIDFGGQSSVPLTSRYDNLLVIQTLSKSRSLAGLRVGFAIGQEDLISGLDRVKNSFNSYPLDALAITGGVASIEDKTYFQDCCRKIIDTREWLTGRLEDMAFRVLPSKTNFVFARHEEYDAAELYRQLKQDGILVRHFDKPPIRDYLRITIGTREDMQRFCEALDTILQTR
jgi:histidinol-phosphate aminotransferase